MARDKYLTRDEILKAEDLVVEEVAVPEWGGVVRVKTLTGEERDRFEAGIWNRQGKERRLQWSNVRALMVSLAVVDENDRSLFTPRDMEALGAKSGVALERVFDVAMRLAGLLKGDLEEAVEDHAA